MNRNLRPWAFLPLLLLVLFAPPAPGADPGQNLFDFIGPLVEPGGSRLGTAVCGGGDLNADGTSDYLVGNSREALADEFPGGVRIYSGTDGALLHTFCGEPGETDHGSVAAFAGDVNADGYDDVIMGNPGHSGAQGLIRVFSGKDSAELYEKLGVSTESIQFFGCSVAGAGDVDLDGYHDFLVGAKFESGSFPFCGCVHLYSGKDGSSIYTMYGEGTQHHFGSSVACAGDLNADGYPDFVVGAKDAGGSNRGEAYAYSGKDGTELYDKLGPVEGKYFGQSVAGAGDVNADGYDDFLVGAPDMRIDGDLVGAAYVYSGKDGAQLYRFTGTDIGGKFGWAVAGAGDYDNDGCPDVLVGSLSEDGPSGGRGAVRVYSGMDGSLLDLFRGQTTTSNFGVVVSGAGDRDDDGHSEILIGSPLHEVDGLEHGAAFVRGPDLIIPTGTVTIADGADWTATEEVTLTLSYQDVGKGVTDLRLKNGSAPWADWITATTSILWTLPTGDGEKLVYAEFKDGAGNVSTTALDMIHLDQTGPTGTVLINDGNEWSRSSQVTLDLTWDDAGIGALEMRLTQGSEAWQEWRALESPLSWSLPSTEGGKVVKLQLKDHLDNESITFSDEIKLDRRPPSGAFTLNDGDPYVLPGEPLLFEVSAEDVPGGSGLEGFLVDFEQAPAWSDLIPMPESGAVQMPWPPLEGLVTAQVLYRDVAGNLSETYTTTLYLVEANLPMLGPKQMVAADLDGRLEVDAYRVALVAGDALSVKVKSTGLTKSTPLVMALDLAGPGPERLVKGSYPAASKKPGIKKFVAPSTGVYWLLLRRREGSPGETGSYELATKLKQGKLNKGAKGVWTVGEIEFDAAEGTLFSAKLKGAGLTAEQVALTGPLGPVSLPATDKKGKVTIAPVRLDAGTGTYRMTLTGTAPIAYKIKLSRK